MSSVWELPRAVAEVVKNFKLFELAQLIKKIAFNDKVVQFKSVAVNTIFIVDYIVRIYKRKIENL